MAREEDGAIAAHPPHEVADLHHLSGIEPDRRLVEDQDRWVAAQRLGEADALPVSLGERADAAVGHALQPAHREDLGDRARAPGTRDPLEARDEMQVRRYAQLGVERRVFGEVADRTPTFEWLPQGIAPGNPHRAAARREDADENPHRGRLAGTVRSEETDDLSAVHAKRDAGHRVHGPEALGELAHLDHRLRGHGHFHSGGPCGPRSLRSLRSSDAPGPRRRARQSLAPPPRYREPRGILTSPGAWRRAALR